MPPSATYHVLKDEEKARYLHQLDSSLKVIAQNVPLLKDKDKTRAVQLLAEQDNWNIQRLPQTSNTTQTLAQLVQRIREEYSWFNDTIDLQEPRQNKGYFSEININAESGLPWQYDLMELHRLKREGPKMLGELSSYKELLRDWQTMLLGDEKEVEKVAKGATELQRRAMQRSFLEQLQHKELLGWESNGYSLKPSAERTLFLGGEELWNISFIRYSLASGMFQIYVMDVWQDIREPQIKLVDGKGVVSSALEGALKFGEDNAAWYIIKEIDEKFKSIHPVHVSRALVGPFESKYLTKPERIEPLQITQELLQKDPLMGLFRFSWQYAYAPNHEVNKQGELQQKIYREDWRQEVIVGSARYAGRIAESVQGTDVHVWQR